MSDSKAQNASAGKGDGKLGFLALVAIVVGSMLGGGVYSLPQNTAQGASLGPILIAWAITGFGVYFIANSFRILSDIRPDLKAGVYMYAREGFGPFVGFLTAWGYWLMTMFGNVAFAVILMDSLDYFVPGVFAGGNNLTSIICGSILIWGYNFLVLSGIRVAGFVNTVGTIAKLVPLLLFVIIVGVSIDASKIGADFWGHSAPVIKDNLGSIGSQIMAPMLVALWCFIGVEGAVVLSGRARKKSDVGKATLLGFVIALLVYVLLSALPFGIMSQAELEAVANPSTAGVLEKIMGKSGSWIMNLGLIVSVLAGWLAWTMLCAEVPMVAAENGTFPKAFARTNKNAAASVSLWVSSSIMQATMLLVYFSSDAWDTMYSISSVVMLPAYLFTTLFLFKLCATKQYGNYAENGKGEGLAIVSGIIGALFCLFMFYAGGMQYVVAVPLLLTVGVPFFIWARTESNDGKAIFTKLEIFYLILLLALDVLAIVLYTSGAVKL